MKHQHIYDLCKQHMHSYVLVETEDGNQFDGILTGLDGEYAYFAVPNGPDMQWVAQSPHGMQENSQQSDSYHANMNTSMPNLEQYSENHTSYRNELNEQQDDTRQFYGYPSYGWGYPGYGFGYRPRRFNRLILPLAALVALSAIPWY